MSTNGKGSKPRPFSVPREIFEENWNRIFKKENPIPTDHRLIEEREPITTPKKKKPTQ